MKKLIFACAVFLVAAHVSYADIGEATVVNGKTLIMGETYTLSWGGTPQDGVPEYSVYLVAGTLRGNDDRFLGVADASKNTFDITVPTDIKPGTNFIIQFSGAKASGSAIEDIKIVRSKAALYGSKLVVLKTPNDGALAAGKDNISWRGGSKQVHVGLLDSAGKLLGWISLKEKPNSKMTWNGKKVCDLTMKVCSLVSSLTNDTAFKILLVSADKTGNYALGTNANSDTSDSTISLTPVSTQERVKLLLQAISQLQAAMLIERNK